MEELVIWVCEVCGQAVDAASNTTVSALAGSEIYARVERTQEEHTTVCGCEPGLDVQTVMIHWE